MKKEMLKMIDKNKVEIMDRLELCIFIKSFLEDNELNFKVSDLPNNEQLEDAIFLMKKL
jgi:hypothetical protein